MKILFILLFVLFSFAGVDKKYAAIPASYTDTMAYTSGNFTDDYGILYRVSDSLWIQEPGIKYHILKWNREKQYLIARNDDKNPSEAGLYTRIDYMPFENMKPYLWGFCYTVYGAKNDSIAEHAEAADRSNPRKGCGGYPFSRMKKAD